MHSSAKGRTGRAPGAAGMRTRATEPARALVSRAPVREWSPVKLFLTRLGALVLAAVAVQQMIVAASVYFLAEAAARLGDPQAFLRSFSIYVAALVLPYLPGVLSQYLAQLWKADIFSRFHRVAVDRHPYAPADFPRSALRQTRPTIFANSAQASLGSAADYLYELSAALLNSAMSMIAVAAVVDVRIGLAYLASIAACAVYISCFYGRASLASSTAERKRVALASVAQRMWPNLVLANRLARDTWMSRLHAAHAEYRAAVRSEARVKYGSSVMLSLLSVAPSAVVILHIASTSLADRAHLAELVVTVPRVFQILAMLSFLIYLLFDLSSALGRLKVLDEFFERADEAEHPIRFDHLTLADRSGTVPIASVGDLVDLVWRPGRYRLEGPNGAGKSTLLLAAKARLGDRAFYVPAEVLLDLPSSTQVGSTGQQKRREIEAVLHDARPAVLLLDEWDANLDPVNARDVDALLEAASRDGLSVVEVRHRRPPPDRSKP
jgi:ABC-type multidrug transport system fused ATPase/permease subunit